MKIETHTKKTVEQFITVNTTRCDNCKREVCDHGEMIIGGSYKGGWLHLSRTPQSTSLQELQKCNSFDFCSVKCLKEWIDKNKELT